MAFGWADYLVCILVLIVSSVIGIYYRFTGDKQRTNKEFLLANNDANMWAVGCSLMATFMSSITILGVSSEIYTYGIQFVVINISYGIFTPLAAHLYLPVFFKLRSTSAYEYLERRFGIVTRLVASLAFSIQMILYMGIVVYAPALALEAVTGVGHVYAVLIIGIVCTFYAGLGGMKAVLMTDVFQSLLMFAAVFCVIVSALLATGFTRVMDIAAEHGRLDILNFDIDPTVRHTWWSLGIGGGFTFLSLYAVNQAQVQRYLSVKDLRTAQKSLYLNWPILSLLSISTCMAGLCIFSKYYDCDPVLTKRISSADQLMPRYVLDTMGNIPGLSGLFVAGIFSGSLSTVSSALNSLSAVTVEDYLKPVFKRLKGHSLDESTAVIYTKVISVIYGGCCLAVAFIAKYLGAVLQAALTIFGVVGGPVLATFTLGMFIPFGNEVGSLAGLATGLSLGFWLGFGGPKPPLPVLDRWSSKEGCEEYSDITINKFVNSTTPKYNPSDFLYVYRLSYQWYIVISFFVTLVTGVLFSWVGSKVTHQADLHHPDLFIPPVARFLEKKRRFLDVNVNDTGSQNSGVTLKGISMMDEDGVKNRE
ncbi:hypothetical protein RUM43_006837 [Polyplax serrata]|uniref:Sodium-dependent multivitamin transporter n=1 Tax=Polyplax serrata TaxID=468196 RepID=A0AAN8P7V2_POLSC